MAEVRNDVLPLVTKDGVRAAVQSGGGPGGGGGDIQFVLQGPDLDDLETLQRGAARARSRRFPAWSTSTRR